MENSFTAFQLAPFLLEALHKKGIEIPTDIQNKVIPEMLEGQNVLARSQTGTGKTLAFLLPILSKLDSSNKDLQALILSPTHELAMQTYEVVKELTAGTGILSDAFIGSANINRQLDKLKKQKPQIVVGTPGRVLELVERKKLKMHQVKFVAVDEADRFVQEREQWKTVVQLLKRIDKNSQYIFVSATMNEQVKRILSEEVYSPVYLSAEGELVSTENVDHGYMICDLRDRINVIQKLTRNIPIERGIVFVNHIDKVNETTEKLQYKGIKALSISADLEKTARAKALKMFHEGEVHILVASDVAARGLDVSDVTHIINLHLPFDEEAYLHRAGRTGRMGKSGTVLSFAEPRELFIIEKFEKALGMTIEQWKYERGQLSLKQK
ncbi:DEAD/DEAH box helicase [Bacillus alkalicellulosilyticus]|uniref:DEAD/DEAH box helicase n=1 Tax=Alkalihalobacterium alkalicellulosilyticum TaxID=1912214 RepID=UPI000997BD3C|nr:DEAD/DEAH box helicase [Bacillus alkalicellulosilyticus]